jgi:predicted outer membrane repeat protein
MRCRNQTAYSARKLRVEQRRSTVTVTSSTFSGNSATRGGGIFNLGGLTLTGSTVSGNSATQGGGIYTEVTSEQTITSSTISGNSATQGGGIFQHSGPVWTKNTIVAGNTASSSPDISAILIYS